MRFDSKKTGILFSVFLCISNLCSLSVNAQAVSDASTNVQTDTTDALILLQNVFSAQYSDLTQKVKNEIVENGYDYELTMDTFYEKGNPYKDIDFISILAAYMSAKEFNSEGNKETLNISEIPFITYNMRKDTLAENLPIHVDDYIPVKGYKGMYQKNGFHYTTKEYESVVYEEAGESPDGIQLYRKTDEMQTIVPQKATTEYGVITFNILDADHLMNLLGVKRSEIDGTYESRMNVMKGETSNDLLRQNSFVTIPNTSEGKWSLALTAGMPVTDALTYTAKSLMGMIPYEWGGKSSVAGWNNNWWTYNDADGLQRGLDCSGFVQWVYMTAGFNKSITDHLYSTTAILNSGFTEVTEDDLQPGDVGVKEGSEYNHCGIYAGDGKWYHCSSAADTVVCSAFNFTSFFRPYEDKESASEGAVIKSGSDVELLQNITYTPTESTYSDDDVLTLAKLIEHEARNEGLNGWIAVAEVVKNRMNSGIYPRTVQGVVYDPGQFSGSSEIESIVPRQQIIDVAKEVLNGDLSILNNSKVLYFRNPEITDGFEVTDHKDWGKYKYYTAVGHHAFYLQP